MQEATDKTRSSKASNGGTAVADLHAVILAAGEGARMGGGAPKCLRQICGKSILDRLLGVVRALRPARIHLVVGAGARQIRDASAGLDIKYHIQNKPLGTADAAQRALPGIPAAAVMLVLMADLPLLRADSLRKIVREARHGRYALLSMRPPSACGYGRIRRDINGAVTAITVEKDASAAQLKIQECDAGVVAMPAAFARKCLPKIGFGRKQKERLITDLPGMARAAGVVVVAHEVPHSQAAGVNSPAQLAAAQNMLSERRTQELAVKGVVFADRRSVLVRGTIDVGSEVFVDRNVIFEGQVRIGKGVRIGANCLIRDSRLERYCVVEPFCHVCGSQLGERSSVGPFARLREGTAVRQWASIGNFIEVKNSTVGSRSKLRHFGYLGDVDIGASVNVGAGAVVCNYDGEKKHKSAIRNGAFVGSNSTLVSPVAVGSNAYVAAGSVVTSDVPDNTIVFGRAKEQVLKPRLKKRAKR